MRSKSKKSKIISIAPGRVCLFGDHQDYLELPIIACAINRYMQLIAKENETSFLHVKKIDTNEEIIVDIEDEVVGFKEQNCLLRALKVLRRYGCYPNKGYDIVITGNIPTNAGLSSSSALVVVWINFLLEAFGSNHSLTSEYLSKIAYETEVLEFGLSGGKMDQFSIGLGNIIYLETGDDFFYEQIHKSIGGVIVAESGIPKNTINLLKELKENFWLSIQKVKEFDESFKIENVKLESMEMYLNLLPDSLKLYLEAAIRNYYITQSALREFKKSHLNYKRIGKLMNEHHRVLRDLLKVTEPKIDNMIDSALNAGAYGAKIVGSRGGASIVVIAPEGKEQMIINSIIKSGAKDAYSVDVDSGARISKM